MMLFVSYDVVASLSNSADHCVLTTRAVRAVSLSTNSLRLATGEYHSRHDVTRAAGTGEANCDSVMTVRPLLTMKAP
jgi:hypothetical protein